MLKFIHPLRLKQNKIFRKGMWWVEMESLNETSFIEDMKEKIESNANLSSENGSIQSHVSQSGNSDVNINIDIQIDVKPIAFAYLYSLLASQQISNEDFEKAIKRLNEY